MSADAGSGLVLASQRATCARASPTRWGEGMGKPWCLSDGVHAHSGSLPGAHFMLQPILGT